MTTITGKDGIAFVQLAARRGALRLEVAGFRRRGQTAYSICKQVYGLKGDKSTVLRQMDAMVEDALLARAAKMGTNQPALTNLHTFISTGADRCVICSLPSLLGEHI